MFKIYSFMSFALSKVNRDLSLKEMVRYIIAIAIIGIAVNGLTFSSLNAKSLDEILSDKKIRIGINPNFPNMSVRNSNGDWEGLILKSGRQLQIN